MRLSLWPGVVCFRDISLIVRVCVCWLVRPRPATVTDTKLGEIPSKPCTMFLPPSTIHYIHSEKDNILTDSIEQSIIDLSRKIVQNGDLPKIQAVLKEGQYFTLNNSQLDLCRRLEEDGKCTKVKVDVVPLSEVPEQVRGMMVIPGKLSKGETLLSCRYFGYCYCICEPGVCCFEEQDIIDETIRCLNSPRRFFCMKWECFRMTRRFVQLQCKLENCRSRYNDNEIFFIKPQTLGDSARLGPSFSLAMYSCPGWAPDWRCYG